jgi:hypothetical protein
LLIHTHDTFKGESQQGVPLSDPKSHAPLARNFVAAYCDETDLLAMIQYHDEPFALYGQFGTKGKCNQERFRAMLNAIQDWNLFLAFNIIDGCTASKSREPSYWLFAEVENQIHSRFLESDIIP